MRQEDPNVVPAWIELAAKVTRRLPAARARIIDWIWRESDKRFLARMAPQLGGHFFDCCLGDMVARYVFFAGSYAQHELAFMRAVLRPGMGFVDIGAHWGLLTMLASHLVGNSGQVIALEPDPRMLTKLRFNLKLNGITTVNVLECAAADCNADLTLSGYDPGHKKWTASKLVQRGCGDESAFVAHARPLDELMDEVGAPIIDLVKIDVEGAEDLVLKGMEEGLHRQRYKRILLELHPLQLAERRRTTSQVADFLLARGYHGYLLDSSRKGCRRAFYHPWRHFSELLLPLELAELGSTFHATPHTVWLCPGLPPLF